MDKSVNIRLSLLREGPATPHLTGRRGAYPQMLKWRVSAPYHDSGPHDMSVEGRSLGERGLSKTLGTEALMVDLWSTFTY